MTAALLPTTSWWDTLLSFASSLNPSSSVSTSPGGGGSSSSGRTTERGVRPDADILAMDPADALAALTQRHADAVYRVALSVTRSHELAEDVAQDALLKAWTALPTFRSDSPLKNWLLRITHNTAISALRRQRDVHIDPAEMPEAAVPAHHAVEARVEARVSVGAFEDALQQLDELSRSIVVLREVEGMSYEEISQVLDVGLPTVKTRLLRARRVLATALEGWRP